MKFLGQDFLKLQHKQDRQTDKHTYVTERLIIRTRDHNKGYNK